MSIRDKMKQKAQEGPKPLPYPISRCCEDGFSEAWVSIRKEQKREPVAIVTHDKRTRRAKKSVIQPKPFVSYVRVAKFFRCWKCQKPTGHRLRILGDYRKRFPSSLWMRLQNSRNFFLEELPDGGLIEYDWTKHPFYVDRARGARGVASAALSEIEAKGPEIHSYQPSFQAYSEPGDAQEPGDDPTDIKEVAPSADGIDFASQEDAF